MQLPLTNITFDKLFSENGIDLTILRLDKIHEEVSGNKLFKLNYFIEECLFTSHKTLLTFGGAFSNHLVATAYLCKQKKLRCIGIVRGEKPTQLSHTLLHCIELGMEIKFISRNEYSANTADLAAKLKNEFGHFITVPEGGFDNKGAEGAALIMDLINENSYSHICTPVGTATTLAGLILNKNPAQEIIAIPVIKNMTDIQERLSFLNVPSNYKPIIFDEYHFGGYAKFTDNLISFMNFFYEKYAVPTDFVYTAKMMYAITDKIKKGFFKEGSNILCLHTGGLQGNKSLKQHTLIF